ncbi:DUF4129 domain-containing protein [Halorarum halobium]|uniref:DUF4129 domain-containing protein n=1 Tax=Halorarum halobium TaxID=3075121 RepID=UPI0028AF8688|nr:DUF4129 domain-containing protein [Halobaculum sp. XH14]
MVDRRTAATALLAALAVLALGAAAATLDSATSTSNSGGFGAGSASEEEGFGGRPAGGIDFGGESAGAELGVTVCVEFLTRPLVQLTLLAAVGLFFLAVYRTTGAPGLSALFVAAACFPFGVVYLALVSCTRSPTQLALSATRRTVNASGLGAGGGSSGMNAAGDALSTPTTLVGVLIVLALLGSLALLFVSTGDDEREPAEEEPDLPPADRRAALGALAGEAADRLEADAVLGNEVYRAWSEMTALLDVENPRASTPAEFADAAVDAGMDRADVAELTDVFEAVRYGGADPTAEREERAIAAFRRIEGTYADGTSDPADRAGGATDGAGTTTGTDESGDGSDR